jgi:hypothetical protein
MSNPPEDPSDLTQDTVTEAAVHPKLVGRLRKVVAAALTALTGGGSVLLHYLGTSSSDLARYATASLFFVSAATAARVALHLKLHYLWHPLSASHPTWTAKRRSALSSLVGLDGLVALGAAGGGYRLYNHPNSDLLVGVLFAFAVIIVLSSTATIKLARHAALPRGSDTIRGCRAVAWLEELRGIWESFPGVKSLARLLTNNTKRNEVSRLVMVLVAVLWAAAVLQAPLAVPDFFHWIKPGRSDPVHVASPEPGHQHAATGPGISSPQPPRPEDPGGSPKQPIGATTHSSTGYPTYEELCGATNSPGVGVPTSGSVELLREASELNYVWLLNGAVIAGCAARALPLFDGRAVYYIVGQCNGLSRSLAIVSPEYPAAIVLDPLAHFALELALQDVLIGASERGKIGPEGDYQVLDTIRGPYLGIRNRQTDGQGGPLERPKTCAELSPAKIKDVILQPGMAKLWLYLATTGLRTWPARDTAHAQHGTTYYTFYDAQEPDTTVATGSCSGTNQCQLTSAAGTWYSQSIPPIAVTATSVKDLGPLP